jgi:hypothetical protein
LRAEVTENRWQDSIWTTRDPPVDRDGDRNTSASGNTVDGNQFR